MPFDGFGNFLRLYSWVVDATNSVKIRADRHDAEDNNFTAGLSNCITKDGQSVIAQNIPWNSRRITALADPVAPQDAATMAYADTKLSASGGGTVTGNVTITGTLTTTGAATVGGTVTATGYQTRTGQAGAYSGHYFNINWNGSTADLWIDSSDIGAIATQAYANTKLPLTGGTITGNLQVTGEVGGNANIFRFGNIGSSPGYIQWQGGATYVLGSAGTVWHSGNFNPAALTGTVSNGRLALAGQPNFVTTAANTLYEPYPGAMITGWAYGMSGGTTPVPTVWIMRYMQLYTTNWFTVGTA